jgi:hypothetical protein
MSPRRWRIWPSGAWNMLTNGEFYRDPGADYYTGRVPAKTKTRAVRQLESLGYRVTLEPIPTPHNEHPRHPMPPERPAGHLGLSSPLCYHLIFVRETANR